MKKIVTATAIAALCATTATTAHAASTIGLQHGKLVTVSNGKVVKGYKVYKNKLYYNGKLTTGRVKYGKGTAMKLYHNGVLQKGIYVTKNYKRIFKDGYVIKGQYTYRTEKGIDAIFYNGVLTHLIEVDGPYLRDNGKLKKGLYTIKDEYIADESNDVISYIALYENGKTAKGIKFAEYLHQKLLFKDGLIPSAMIYKGHVYENGLRVKKNQYVFVDNQLYVNDQTLTGQYDSKYYEAGIFKGSQETVDYVARRTKLQQANAETLPALVQEQLQHAVENYDVIVKDLGRMERNYEDELTGKIRLADDLRDLQQIILKSDAPDRDALHAQVERVLEEGYAKEGYLYRDGKIVTGWYDGNFYELGDFVRTGAEQWVLENSQALSICLYDLANLEDFTKAETTVQQTVQQFMTLLQNAEEVLTLSKTDERVDTSDAVRIIEDSLETRKDILQHARRLNVMIDSIALDEQIIKANQQIGKTVSFKPSNENATYMPIKVNEQVTGTFDADGYAYMTVTLTDAEGNYTFNGNVADHLISLSDQQQTVTMANEQKASTVTYLKDGQYYVILKGEPNASYETTFTKRSYNAETITNWQPAKNVSGNRVKVPMYAQTPTIPLHLSTNEAIRFYIVRSDMNYSIAPIKELQLTNTATGTVYKATAENNSYYYANVPNGDYTVSVTPHARDIGTPNHIAINYQLIPMLGLKTPTSNMTMTTLEVTKDTTYTVTLKSRNEEPVVSDSVVNIYDDTHQVVKQFTLPVGKSSKKFTYTLSKGRYTVNTYDDLLYMFNK